MTNYKYSREKCWDRLAGAIRVSINNVYSLDANIFHEVKAMFLTTKPKNVEKLQGDFLKDTREGEWVMYKANQRKPKVKSSGKGSGMLTKNKSVCTSYDGGAGIRTPTTQVRPKQYNDDADEGGRKEYKRDLLGELPRSGKGICMSCGKDFSKSKKPKIEKIELNERDGWKEKGFTSHRTIISKINKIISFLNSL